jgi:hypothetical protein
MSVSLVARETADAVFGKTLSRLSGWGTARASSSMSKNCRRDRSALLRSRESTRMKEFWASMSQERPSAEPFELPSLLVLLRASDLSFNPRSPTAIYTTGAGDRLACF